MQIRTFLVFVIWNSWFEYLMTIFQLLAIIWVFSYPFTPTLFHRIIPVYSQPIISAYFYPFTPTYSHSFTPALFHPFSPAYFHLITSPAYSQPITPAYTQSFTPPYCPWIITAYYLLYWYHSHFFSNPAISYMRCYYYFELLEHHLTRIYIYFFLFFWSS